MARNDRWKQRPENSTWGDYGPNDQLGRMNELNAERIRQAVAEVKEGRTFCLSMPLDTPGGAVLNPRRHPPLLRPTLRGERPVWMYRTEFDHPGLVDVINDDMVLLHLQYSSQWDTLAHVGALFDADGDGVAEPVFYNGYRGGTDIVGPSDPKDAGALPGTFVEAKSTSRANALGVENMAEKCLQGRGVMIDLFAHFGRRKHAVTYDDLMRVIAADGIKVEAGDFVCLRTGFDNVILEQNKKPTDRGHAQHLHRSRRQRRKAPPLDHGIEAGRADLGQLRGRGPQRTVETRPVRGAAPAPALPVQDRRQSRRDLAAVATRGLAAQQQPQPLPDDGAAAQPAGRGRLARQRHRDGLTPLGGRRRTA